MKKLELLSAIMFLLVAINVFISRHVNGMDDVLRLHPLSPSMSDHSLVGKR